jgi:hypothetical protein
MGEILKGSGLRVVKYFPQEVFVVGMYSDRTRKRLNPGVGMDAKRLIISHLNGVP